jgi:predicted permease
MFPPKWFYTIPLRLRSVFRRKSVEQELEDELQFHLEHHAEIQMAKGLPPEEARREALRAIGGLTQRKEECRDMRKTRPLEIIWRDIRYGLRSLKSSPLFTLVAILSLALGIGANTAIFTLMYGILWKPLPVRDPGQLVQLMRISSTDSDGGYSWYLYRQLSETAPPFGELIAKTAASREKFGGSIDCPERVMGEAVSANYFRALRVAALRGRLFDPADDNISGGSHLAVLSQAFWAARFRSDSSILGKTIYYGEAPYVVVGIAEAGFAGVQPGTAVDMWVPVTAVVPVDELQAKNGGYLKVFARLNTDGQIGEAQGIWNARFHAYITTDLLARYAPEDRPRLLSERIALRPARSGLAGVFQQYRKPVFLLMGIAALVLLISCANIANLVLARNAARRREIELRVALGASRGRVISQLLIESLLIAFSGAAAGIALAAAAAKALIAMLPRSGAPITLDSRPDGAVLGVTIVVAGTTAILFGLLPALRASHTDADTKLKSGLRVISRSFTGRVLVAGQLALSLILLIAAGLFLGTIRNLKATDLGFRPESVTAFDVSFPRDTEPRQIRQAYERILDHIKNAPSVVAVSHVWPSVYSRFRWQRGVAIEGRPFLANQRDFACGVSVGPEFFETLGMSLVAGRYLNPRDQMSASPAMVVNESFASAYFAGVSPLGRHVVVDGAPSENWEVVGVVRDAKHYGVREKVCRTTYVPAGQAPQWNAYAAQGIGSFLLRTSADLPSTAETVRAAISSAGGGVQMEALQPLETAVDDMVNQDHMLAILSSVFAALALVLAAIGLYGVMAYGVSQRTSELGIRMALGATPGGVQRLVMKQTAQLVLLGVGAGIAAALPLGRLAASLLYGVKPGDEMIFAASVLVLTAAAGLAGYLPAVQASRVDPAVALRRE